MIAPIYRGRALLVACVLALGALVAVTGSASGSQDDYDNAYALGLQAYTYGLPLLETNKELYPEVVDALEEEGGVPSRLIKTDRLKAGKEGTPCRMFARSRSGRAVRAGSRWMISRGRARCG